MRLMISGFLPSAHNLGDSLGTALGVLFSRLCTSARVSRDTHDSGRTGLVEERKQRSKEELSVGSVASRVGDTSCLLSRIAAVDF